MFKYVSTTFYKWYFFSLLLNIYIKKHSSKHLYIQDLLELFFSTLVTLMLLIYLVYEVQWILNVTFYWLASLYKNLLLISIFTFISFSIHRELYISLFTSKGNIICIKKNYYYIKRRNNLWLFKIIYTLRHVNSNFIKFSWILVNPFLVICSGQIFRQIAKLPFFTCLKVINFI